MGKTAAHVAEGIAGALALAVPFVGPAIAPEILGADVLGTLGTAGLGAASGAAGGAALAGATGGKPLLGALTGGATEGLAAGLGAWAGGAPFLPSGATAAPDVSLTGDAGVVSGASATPGSTAAQGLGLGSPAPAAGAGAPAVSAPAGVAQTSPDFASAASAGGPASGTPLNIFNAQTVGTDVLPASTPSASSATDIITPPSSPLTPGTGGPSPFAGAGDVGPATPLTPPPTTGPVTTLDQAALGIPTAQPASPGLLGQVGQFFSGHGGQVAGDVITALGLGRSLLASRQPNPIPGMGNVNNIAAQLQTQGTTLSNYLQTGTLPPAVQTAVDQATQDGITTIKARYAGMGVAPGSSAETMDIARLQQDAVVKGATLADQLLQQGISETELSGQLYNELIGYNAGLTNQTNQAIANFATALAGGSRPVILTGGTQTANALPA